MHGTEFQARGSEIVKDAKCGESRPNLYPLNVSWPHLYNLVVSLLKFFIPTFIGVQ